MGLIESWFEVLKGKVSGEDNGLDRGVLLGQGFLETPIHSLTQSCDPISCCGKPVERTSEIISRPIFHWSAPLVSRSKWESGSGPEHGKIKGKKENSGLKREVLVHQVERSSGASQYVPLRTVVRLQISATC